MTTSTANPKQIAYAFYDSYNGGDLDSSFSAYIDAELTNHAMGGAFDRESWKAFELSFIDAFDNVTMSVLDQVAEGDKVATRFELSGTQKSEFAGQPSLGRSATMSATAIDKIRNGKIIEHWVEVSFSDFLQTLAAKS